MHQLCVWTCTLSLGLFACGSEAHEHEEHTGEHTAHEEHADEHAAHQGALALNDGARWPMDDHSRGVFGEMKQTVGAAQFGALTDATATADQLKAQLQRLISGCTMDGPAHDNLHVFLGNYMPAVDHLGSASDLEEANTRLGALHEMLEEHGRFFE